MDYEILKTFIALAKFKNFTKTAENLHIVQSTVTNRIKNLEQNLGQILFTRTNKNVVLTAAGKAYLPYAKQMISIHETAISKLKSLKLFTGTLNIGVVHSIYDCYVQEMILTYMKKYKTISVNVVIDHSENLIQMLHDNEIDIAFIYFEIHSSKFICKKFHTDNIILVTGHQNNYIKNGITNDELKTLPVLSSSILTQSFQEWFHSIFPNNYVYPLNINISENVVSFLKEGIGFSFMMESAADKYIKNGSLSKVKLLESTPPDITSYMLINKQQLNSEGVAKWIEQFS